MNHRARLLRDNTTKHEIKNRIVYYGDFNGDTEKEAYLNSFFIDTVKMKSHETHKEFYNRVFNNFL